jgi:RNA polymerase sigma factor (sigma-70 family)
MAFVSVSSTASTYRRLRERLLKFIRLRIKRFEDAEDILQEIFYQFSRMDSKTKPIEQVAAWLYRVARNKIINYYRDKSYSDDIEDTYISNEMADIVFSTDATPETEYLRSLIMKEIKTALADLPAEQRMVFEQTEFYHVPVKELSEKTHTPINTVLSRKHYAVKFLRKRLQDLHNDILGGK